MAEVIATARGYFGGIVRDAGDRFVVPDDLWKDAKRRPKWAMAAGASAPAAAVAGDDGAKKGRGRGASTQAPAAGPFEEAPAPETVEIKGNGVQEALGTTAPDWVDPNAPQPVGD